MSIESISGYKVLGKESLGSKLAAFAKKGEDVKKMIESSKYNISVGDPQRAYNWEVSISDPAGDGLSDMKFFAKQTAFPPSIVENIKRWYAGVEYHYSGRDVSPRVFRVTFWDNEDLRVYKFFYNWFLLSNRTSTGYKVTPKSYMGSAKLKLLKSHGKSKEYDLFETGLDNMFTDAVTDGYSVSLSGVFPTEISEITLSYTDSAEITFDVMFSYSTKELVVT